MSERIVIDPNVCHGNPVISGTRTPVAAILNALAKGDPFETVERDFSVTSEDIQSCLAFAATQVEQISCPPQWGDRERAARILRLQQLFAEWTEEDDQLSDEQADRLRSALEANRGLGFQSATFD